MVTSMAMFGLFGMLTHSGVVSRQENHRLQGYKYGHVWYVWYFEP
jgi:hypothetical protein